MKKLPKKVLSLFLVFVLAAITLIPAFAYDVNTKEIIDFNVIFDSSFHRNIESVTVDISNIYTDFAGEKFISFEIYNEDGTICQGITPSKQIIKNEDNVFRIELKIWDGDNDSEIKNFSKKTTFVIREGAFISADNQLSPEMSFSFIPNEFSPLSVRLFNPIKDVLAGVFAPIAFFAILEWLPIVAFFKFISFGLI